MAGKEKIRLLMVILLMDRYLGVASLAGSAPETVCSEVPGLVLAQQEVCQKNPESLFCISEGARRGILECQQQFKYERWNCTTSTNQKVFGPVLKKGRTVSDVTSLASAHASRPLMV